MIAALPLSLPLPLPPWRRPRPMELRVDVQLPEPNLEAELARLYGRMQARGDAMHGMQWLPCSLPGLRLHYREADGEHFVHVEDVRRQRLAGYTVFNRLVELNRRADPYLRGPHSKYAPAYQRRGIASAVYAWALGAGMCLISGPRQSPGAHALWRRLARAHPLGFVDLRAKRLHLHGGSVAAPVLQDFHTRMVLLGAGWDFDRLVAATGCTAAAAGVSRG